jgi:hypothetical protein
VPGGEDKSVSVKPMRIIGVVAECVPKENGTDVGDTKRKPEMTGLARGYRVHRETTCLVSSAGKLLKRKLL